MSEEKSRMAAAIRYEPPKDRAPRVTAKGRGTLAEAIIKIAQEQGVPIKQDRALVQLLIQIDLDEEIPVGLYRAVAEVLAFVYRLDESRRP